METIICSKCSEPRTMDQYYIYPKTNKRVKKCSPCRLREAREWKANNPERNKLVNKKWNSNNYSRKRYRDLKQRYNTTPEEYELMFNAQSGNCKICNTNQSQLTKRLAVDHCHTTGKIRGLLCSSCNCMLGYSNDDVKKLQQAIDYLLRSLAKDLVK